MGTILKKIYAFVHVQNMRQTSFALWNDNKTQSAPPDEYHAAPEWLVMKSKEQLLGVKYKKELKEFTTEDPTKKSLFLYNIL